VTTLVEFFDPARSASQSDQVLVVLYYLKHSEGQELVTGTQVQEGLRRARAKNASGINVGRALARAGSKVDKVGGRWSITGTGESYVQGNLELEDSAAPAQNEARDLERLAAKIKDDATQGYILESIKCLKISAYRAAIVFLWTGAVAAMRDKIWESKTPRDIEAALQVHQPKAKFKKKGDFAYVKDGELLQISFDFSLIDKTQKGILGQNLDLRNGCGHPTKYNPGQHKAAGFIEDVVGIVFA
jgi:hypothetical protein